MYQMTLLDLEPETIREEYFISYYQGMIVSDPKLPKLLITARMYNRARELGVVARYEPIRFAYEESLTGKEITKVTATFIKMGWKK